MRDSILIAIFASTLASAAGAAPQSIAVRYSNADLAAAPGAARLAHRIHAAADSVCGGEDVVARTGHQFAACRQAAETQAATEIGSPLVSGALGLASPATLSRR
jgi:UrcA family protein